MTIVIAAVGSRSGKRRSWLRLLALLFVIGWITQANAQSLSPLTGAQQLATGDGHACVLTTAGGVKCWGNNEYGQLGDGTTTHRYLPVNVVGLSSGVVAVSTGYRHSCALLSGGTMKCWGKNFLFALGDGTPTNRSTPVDVQGLSGATAITAGGDHTCALIGLSDLKCWGYNGDGELGIGNTTNKSTPTSIIGGQNLIAVAAGYSHTCALTSSNTVKCWGVYDRACGTFGCGFQYWTSPQAIGALGNDVTAISTGQYFSCALTTGGAVKCWGDNYYDQLGDLGGTGTPGDDNPDPLTPFPISGLDSGVISISAGYRHACAQLSNGTERCWGDNATGQLGDGSTERRMTPVTVAGLNTIANIAAGGDFSCARMGSSGIKCWGSNSVGQLGDNEPWYRNEPVDVPGLGSGVKSITSGDLHTCAVTATGAVKCWGANASGQIGDGTTVNRTTPTAVSGLTSGASQVSAGLEHSCAVTAGGAVKCWGSNDEGQLGDGSYDQHLTPVLTVGLTSGVTKVGVGARHSCARSNTGPPKCWGRNGEGQIGDASFTMSQPTPVNVVNLATGVSDISGGHYHTCAVVPGGKIACWGDNNDGQIGDGSYDTAYIPTMPTYPDQDTIAISAGGSHSCAVSAGRVYCWGDNNDGRCGIGISSGTIGEPAWVQTLPNGATAVSGGLNHTCAITAGGQAYCWGYNGQGQLGDKSIINRNVPVAVSGLGSGVSQISAGGYHSCALTSGGNVKCWGYNTSGQLGIGIRNYRLPADVLDYPSFFRDGFESP